MTISAIDWVRPQKAEYTRPVFEAIVNGLGHPFPYVDALTWDDRGVWLKAPESDRSLAWHPRCETLNSGGPDPLTSPWLPFPFSARDLAAWMVDGWGYFIREKYGDWQDGPDEYELLSIGLLGGKAKDALRGAYAAYRHADEMTPRLDGSLEDEARELTEQYNTAREEAMAREELRKPGHTESEYAVRLARVNDAVADLGLSMREARCAADVAYARWRQAVVQHLLLPIEDVPTAAFECLLLRGVPPTGRAKALHQIQSHREFADSAAGAALWDLMLEVRGVEQEIRYWQLFNAQNITEAARRKDELKELDARLAALKARMNDTDQDGGGKLPRIDAAQESTEQRQQRRLGDLRALGGDWVKRGADWRAKDRQSGAFGKLVEQERGNGSRNCSEKSVRRDLCAAAVAEAEKRRTGVMLKGLTSP
jgi:hypothetical protein